MLYAFLCYNDEDAVLSWTKEQDDAVMTRLGAVHAAAGEGAASSGPIARLMPTTAATTLRKDTDPPLVIDGPFAETKEQLLGFYLVDCEDLEAALDVARDLGKANPGGAYEIRPVGASIPGRWRKGRRWTPRLPNDRARLDRRGADRRPSPGGRRAAALFPRPRPRRGGVPGRLSAGAEDLARERSAARRRRLADHGRPQRRHRPGAPPQPPHPLPDEDQLSDLDDVEAPMAERLDDRPLPRRRAAAAVHLLPPGPAGRPSRSRWRCASSRASP